MIGYVANHCCNYEDRYDNQRQHQRQQFPAQLEFVEKCRHQAPMMYTSMFSMIYPNGPRKASRYGWRKVNGCGMFVKYVVSLSGKKKEAARDVIPSCQSYDRHAGYPFP
jgi:hypothetical protein